MGKNNAISVVSIHSFMSESKTKWIMNRDKKKEDETK